MSASCRIPTDTEYELKTNESVKFRYPSLLTTETYPAYVNYYLKLNNGVAKKAIPATMQTITNALVNGLGTDIKVFNKESTEEITDLVGELNTYLETKISGLEKETLKDNNGAGLVSGNAAGEDGYAVKGSWTGFVVFDGTETNCGADGKSACAATQVQVLTTVTNGSGDGITTCNVAQEAK